MLVFLVLQAQNTALAAVFADVVGQVEDHLFGPAVDTITRYNK
jgi:hypothetical protein